MTMPFSSANGWAISSDDRRPGVVGPDDEVGVAPFRRGWRWFGARWFGSRSLGAGGLGAHRLGAGRDGGGAGRAGGAEHGNGREQ